MQFLRRTPKNKSDKEKGISSIVRTRSRGFTLLELVVVIAILGIIAAIAVPQLIAYQKRAYDSMAYTDAKNFYQACVNAAVGIDGSVRYSSRSLPPGYTGASPISGSFTSASRWTGNVVCNAKFKHPKGTKTYVLNNEGEISSS